MKNILLFTVVMFMLSIVSPLFAGDACCASDKKKTEASCIQKTKFKNQSEKIEAYKKHYKDLKLSELKEEIKNGKAFIIDVNGKESYEKAHLPGAVNFYDEKALVEALPKNKDALIVVYCGGPKCSAWFQGADYVTEKGYTNVKHFSKGIKGWLSQS